MPETPEELRARLKVLGHAWCLLSLRFPAREVLRKVVPQCWNDYVDFLLGEEIFGCFARDHMQRVVSAPDLSTLLSYEFQVRKEMAAAMNRGFPLPKALKEAMENRVVKERYFTTPLALAALRPRRRSRTPTREPRSKGRGRKGSKGRGRGKEKDGLHSQTPDGKGICYRYNNAKEKCRGPCRFAHVCRKCLGQHLLHMCPDGKDKGADTK